MVLYVLSPSIRSHLLCKHLAPKKQNKHRRSDSEIEEEFRNVNAFREINNQNRKEKIGTNKSEERKRGRGRGTKT